MSLETSGIRALAKCDLLALVALEQSAMPNPWSGPAIAATMERASCFALGVFGDGTLAGFVLGCCAAGQLEIFQVLIHARWRRRGWGAALLEQASNHARALGCEMAYLEVRESNSSARHFYRALGFKEVGRRRGYYQDNHETAVLMAKPLERAAPHAPEIPGVDKGDPIR